MVKLRLYRPVCLWPTGPWPFQTAAQNDYKGIIEYTEDPLVSLDIKGNAHSCVIDGTLTSVVGNHLKLIAWFDNEYGFTTRMIDWLVLWKMK